jgi:hypothetical protein
MGRCFSEYIMDFSRPTPSRRSIKGICKQLWKEKANFGPSLYQQKSLEAWFSDFSLRWSEMWSQVPQSVFSFQFFLYSLPWCPTLRKGSSSVLLNISSPPPPAPHSVRAKMPEWGLERVGWGRRVKDMFSTSGLELHSHLPIQPLLVEFSEFFSIPLS